jgi:hypothetical protein
MTDLPRSIPQGTYLVAKALAQFKNPHTGRSITIRFGQLLWVCNTQVDQRQSGTVCVARGSQSLHYDWRFTWADFDLLFSVQP